VVSGDKQTISQKCKGGYRSSAPIGAVPCKAFANKIRVCLKNCPD
jgi:hypothetical protein